MKLKYISEDIRAEQKKLKHRAITPKKETNMKTKAPKTEAPKIEAAPKTIKVSTLFKAAGIILVIVAAFVAGVYASNAYDTMLDTEAESRAAALLKLNSKQ